MLTVGDLSLHQLTFLASRGRFFFDVGPFRLCLKTAVRSLIHFFHRFYADFPTQDRIDFADFHIHIGRPRFFRRWVRPQVFFEWDGHRPFHPYPLNMAVPLFEWGLNWCIAGHAHGWLLIHAAVLEKNGKACLLAAKPESGKSTLCALLTGRGWRLLSDELAMIEPGTCRVHPLPRPISLKGASIGVVRTLCPQLTVGALCRNRETGERMAYGKPPAEAVERMRETAEVSWLVFPRFQSRAALHAQGVPRSRALLALADNAFNHAVLGREGFETLAGVVERAAAWHVAYGEGEAVLRWFDERIAA